MQSVFICYKSLLSLVHSTFQPKEVSVINLGDTAQSDYKLQAKNTLSDKEGLYRDTVLDYE